MPKRQYSGHSHALKASMLQYMKTCSEGCDWWGLWKNYCSVENTNKHFNMFK